MQAMMSFGDFGRGPSPHQLVIALVGRYVSHIGEMNPTQNHGETVQAFNKRKTYAQGMKETFGITFETAIGYARVARYGASIDPVPIVSAYELENDLFKTIEHVWEETVGVEGKSKSKKSAATWEEFMEGIADHIKNYVFPADLEDAYMEARQRDILEGKVPPTPEDKDWLSAKADELETQAANIRSMVQ
jgi:hypothetical protein